MRVFAVAVACLACTGHGRRVHTTSQGPTHQVGLSGRVGKGEPKDSLASLLLMRGGYSSFDRMRGGEYVRRGSSRFDDVRGGYGRRHGYVRRGRSSFDDMRGGYAGSLPMTLSRSRGVSRSTRYAFANSEETHVQGKSLKTWSFPSSLVDRVQVVLTTDGRPLDADVQLWQGPDNTPCKMRVYSEDGLERPFIGVIATPDTSGGDKTVAIRNTGQIEFPLTAYVTASEVDEPFSDFHDTSVHVQGGSLRTFNFDTTVESVEVMLETDGRPLNARIELLQGPNNNKQVIELQTEDGLERPFFAIMDTSGSGHVVRVVNTAPVAFPMTVSVQPHSVY